MKDEELAEKEYKNCKFEKIEHYCDKAIFITGFLAGLKAGRPQWHYDKSVPCGKTETIRVIIFDNQREPLTILPTTQIEFINGQKEHIIAWCEIPTFDKE